MQFVKHGNNLHILLKFLTGYFKLLSLKLMDATIIYSLCFFFCQYYGSLDSLISIITGTKNK